MHLGGVLGGIIGAGGAATAVYLTLTGQRQEDRDRIQGALIREVKEFSRAAVGHLDICESIRSGEMNLPATKLPQAMKMPTPIIYPAVADKIGLLNSPQHVVAFYMRITEVAFMAQAVADDPSLQRSHLQENNVRLIVEALVDICQFATWIIQNREVESAEVEAFDRTVSDHILSEMDSTTRRAKEKFQLP